jgi:hypothetical protein
MNRLLGANFILRLGMDSHRAGATNDVDYRVAELLFTQMKSSGGLVIDNNGLIDFDKKITTDVGNEFVRLYEPIKYLGYQSTLGELAVFENTPEVQREELEKLAKLIVLTASQRADFFNAVVNPCKGIFSTLA